MAVDSVGDTDYYSFFEVAPGADISTIEKAISRKMRLFTTRTGNSNKQIQRQAEDDLATAAEARKVLLDPDRRRAYDAQLRSAARVPAQSRSADFDQRASTGEPDRAAGGSGQSDRSERSAGSTPPPIDWAARALQELQSGDLKAARYSAREATERNPRDARAWTARGTVSQREQRYDDAVFELTEASRYAPGPALTTQLAAAYEGAGDATNAAAAFQRAISAEPSNAATVVSFAHFWLRQRQAYQAIQLLEPLLTANPGGASAAGAPDVLGWAILDTVEASMVRRSDGLPVFTSAETIGTAIPALQRALSLPLTDHRLADQLRQRLADAEQARQRVWTFPPGGVLRRILGWLALFLIAAPVFSNIAPKGAQDGLLLLEWVVLAVVFVVAYRRPRWQSNARRWR